MGQQQILVLVLGIALVGLAVYTGAEVFMRSKRQQHADLLVSHAVYVASEATTWRSKSPFLGGGDSYVNLETNGMRKLALADTRPPGIVRITFASRDSLEVTAVSDYYDDIGVRVHVSGATIVKTSVSYNGNITFPASD
ncbi:MAG: hypothetical protein ACE5G0_03090 [Rhodothermales bacterium]